ncbi:hypothetical protein BDR26DRAFT_855807 [Obelidium mucronatum]|nr:hypothetical protein BDR26DRAFT_855807 [Obelidium mucronatum]
MNPTNAVNNGDSPVQSEDQESAGNSQQLRSSVPANSTPNPSKAATSTVPKKTVLGIFKQRQTGSSPSSSSSSVRKSTDQVSTSRSSITSESWRSSDADIASESEDEEIGFSFVPTRRIPLAKSGGAIADDRLTPRTTSDQKPPQRASAYGISTTASTEIKRTLSEGALYLTAGYPPAKRDSTASTSTPTTGQQTPHTPRNRFIDPRDWLPGFNNTQISFIIPVEDSDVENHNGSGVGGVPRVASTPLFVQKKDESYLEETADVLGVRHPEDVAKLLHDEGISAWATVLAVGSGVSGSGTPATAPLEDEVTKKSADDTSVSDDASVGTSRPDSTRSPKFGKVRRRRTIMARQSREKRASISSTQARTAEETLKRDFILKLARALTQYGAPSHRLEYHLSHVSKALHVEAEFVIIPGVVMSSFGGGESAKSSTHFVRQSQGINMGKLAQVNALCLTLTQNLITVHNAVELLEGVKAASDYPWWIGILIFPVSSFGVALVLFQATWIESFVAGLLGLLVGLLNYASEKYSSLTYLLEFLSALGSAFLSRSIQGPVHNAGYCFRYLKVTLSAVALFLPGLPLTVAIIDLSSRNMVSGTVRMFGSLFTAMLLGFGMTIGSTAVIWDTDNSDGPSGTCVPTSQWWAVIFFVPMSMSLNLLFQANKHQWPIMVVTAAAGFVANVFLNMIPQLAEQPTVVTALCGVVIGICSNLYARITNDVAIAPILAGILLQVPGSLSVKSTLGFFAANAPGSSDASSSNIVNGVNFTFQMLSIGMSLAMGLFVASLAIFPYRPSNKYLTI